MQTNYSDVKCVECYMISRCIFWSYTEYTADQNCDDNDTCILQRCWTGGWPIVYNAGVQRQKDNGIKFGSCRNPFFSR